MPPVVFQRLERRNGLVHALGSHKLLIYSIFSVLAVSATVVDALRDQSNFYSVVIYLSKSSRSVLAIANCAFLLSLVFGHVAQRIFLGELRPPEVEHLYEHIWGFVTESLVAFSIFRDDFDVYFGVMFGLLLFIKCFHWLAAERIEWMDQRPYPGPSVLFHVRMSTLLLILWAADFVLFAAALEHTLTNGVGGMVLFASEYCILMASAFNIVFKYALSVYDFRRAATRGGEEAPPWESKSIYTLYVELATDFLKLTTYLAFFAVIVTFYGIPLTILRDIYLTVQSFITRLRALHRYKTATRNMDQRYPTATAEEMAALSDHTCIICREEMSLPDPGAAQPRQNEGLNTTPKKLPCGHIFHFHCLRAWLERQQSCPTCRRTVFEDPQRQQQQQQQGPGGGAARGRFIRVQNGRGLMGMARFFGPPQPAPAPAGGVQGNNEAAAEGAQQPGGVDPGLNGANPALQNNPFLQELGDGIPPVVPQGVQIQYTIQYGTMRGQQQRNNQQSAGVQDVPHAGPRPLQPVPHFGGFLGPGGIWQPWPRLAEQANPLIPPPTQTQERTPSGSSLPPASNVTDNNTPGPSSSGPPAREAVASAAMRRSHSGTPSAMPSPPYSLSRASSTESNVSREQQHAGPSSSQQPASPTTFTSESAQRDTPAVPVTETPPPHMPAPRPSQLSEEQLASLDRVTRELFEERLRVLGDVDSRIRQCVDEMTSLRSTFSGVTAETPSRATEIPSIVTEGPPMEAVSSTEAGSSTASQGRTTDSA
ncbi:hypothetical protein FISHEDRAFT_44057 [Fistulina hepatica ATCC 64428]|uniref:RING-type E3 ubiquitin transferase n=1 Tax=Fistulina hepatica ATCC 64428 TaxID=1128425 RepID=A0A0D7ABJ2_9AGAR|nr:hypothetical protein FISHEDRAFT_44057 [Fistulina hepatica ATCC 64428]